MTKTLNQIAEQLSTQRTITKMVTEEKRRIPAREVIEIKPIPKVQLIYAFNGTGKTRLSRELKNLVAPKVSENGEVALQPREKILYYNAFTEDLFYWDNDLDTDRLPKLKIQPNTYTNWLMGLLKDLGQDSNIVRYFQRYVNDKLTPYFNDDFTEVTFAIEAGDNQGAETLKISKGEESNFIWSIFYTLLDQVVSILNNPEPDNRETREFDQLEYVFIDDPVSSLDENHLIELAVDLASLIKSSTSNLKFVITTHSTLFYNVLYNELNSKTCYLLERFEDGTFALTEKHGDSNKSFSYHLYLKQIIEKAISEQRVEKYHFTLLRNLYEKTASFLGYPKWSELLPDDKQLYLNRILNFTSHSTLANETVAQPTLAEQAVVKLLLDHLKDNYGFWKQEQQNG
jgi:hypothetical protein